MMTVDKESKSPRKQHYVFAHLAFRALVEASPMHVLMTLLSKDSGMKLLDETWQQVGTQCTERDLVASDGLAYEIHELWDKRPVILVTMPKPARPHEAYLAAAVIRPPKRRFFLFERPAATEYFTLEVGDVERGDFDTVLGQWRGESHLCYSDSPEVDDAAFLRAVVRVLKGEISPHGTSNHPTTFD
ncbi:MAG: hypothetical protein MI757_01430 [Pirellulales bacterium]|nr:hypothetical protein [Pirellulales bacterium]